MKKKNISIILTLVMVMNILVPVCLATYSPIEGTNPSGGIVDFAPNVLGYIQWFGYAVAVGMLIYIGIKYVMASADTKADLKALLVKYVIGAILIAGASTIAGWIFSIEFTDQQ